MKLVNFEISPDEPTVTIRSGGRDWDLHNFVSLADVRRQGAQVFMTWRVLDPQELGDVGETPMYNTAPCTLRFRGVTHFRDTGEATADNDTVSLISKLDLDRHPCLGGAAPAGLRFDMEGGRVIEVCAETVELVSTESDAA